MYLAYASSISLKLCESKCPFPKCREFFMEDKKKHKIVTAFLFQHISCWSWPRVHWRFTSSWTTRSKVPYDSDPCNRRNLDENNDALGWRLWWTMMIFKFWYFLHPWNRYLDMGNNFVSDGTICTTLCSAQLKKEIYTYLHIVAILDIY